MRSCLKRVLLDYFDQTALRYADIEPAFGPLVDELLELASVQPHERLLDVGTGGGLALRRWAHSNQAFGFDFSRKMLEVAGRHVRGRLFRADVHHLALASDAFDVALVSFTLNSTEPVISLRELYRVLAPGGRVLIQEWGVLDALSELVVDTVAGYAVSHALPPLAAVRAWMEAPVPWDDLDGAQDIVELVEKTGLVNVAMRVDRPHVRLPDVESFIRYQLAWPHRSAEIGAMAADARRLCLGDLRENLAARAEADGMLAWQPEVIRISAYKPAY